MDYKDLAEQLVKKCLDNGANEAEVLIQTGRNLSIEVRNGEIETVEDASSHGVGFRVFVDGKMAFSSCNDFLEGALDDTIGNAIAFAKNMTADENNVLPA
jgi:PmbA protein